MIRRTLVVRWIILSMEGGCAFDPEIHCGGRAACGSYPASRFCIRKPYLDKLRFRPICDPATWNSAVTNGIFVRFGDVELSHDEILAMAEQGH